MQLVTKTRHEVGIIASTQNDSAIVAPADCSTAATRQDLTSVEKRVDHLERELTAVQRHAFSSSQQVLAGTQEPSTKLDIGIATRTARSPSVATAFTTTARPSVPQRLDPMRAARTQSAEVQKLQARLAALMALDSTEAAAQRVTSSAASECG